MSLHEIEEQNEKTLRSASDFSMGKLPDEDFSSENFKGDDNAGT